MANGRSAAFWRMSGPLGGQLLVTGTRPLTLLRLVGDQYPAVEDPAVWLTSRE